MQLCVHFCKYYNSYKSKAEICWAQSKIPSFLGGMPEHRYYEKMATLMMLALGAAFGHAEEEIFGQQLHAALQNQCNSSEKKLDSF